MFSYLIVTKANALDGTTLAKIMIPPADMPDLEPDESLWLNAGNLGYFDTTEEAIDEGISVIRKKIHNASDDFQITVMAT